MNKKLLIFSVITGILVGGISAYVNSPKMNRSYESKTEIIVSTQSGSESIGLLTQLSFKRSGQYEMYFLTDDLVGFNVSGRYGFSSNGLSLMPSLSERVIPNGKKLSLIETIFSQHGIHSMEELKIIRLDDEKTILVAPRYSYLYTKTYI
ncbi:hypothetical protein GCM10007938_04430 [Vibrio zhanjiangensis]|uniref:Uncharacterized protein n=1 Tax=Vibrio zhanjiangensis TaxID=1046128 RepID=A0ABQ6EUJ9_9VIBR|nr:hypothetical protein [Vibrio zhanjiangensis]GLT16667.1 hypothetical protein GCM10007938_04430 [Vibrio zhanjiangensis]